MPSPIRACLLALLLLAVPAAAVVGASRDPGRRSPSARTSSSDDIRVLVLGLNDLHGQIVAGRKIGDRPAGSAGVLVSWLRSRMEAHDGPSFIALAGDCVGASPAASALLQDEPTVSLLNLLADPRCSRPSPRTRTGTCNIVAALGNHEFDEGWEEMLRLWRGGGRSAEDGRRAWKGARFPVLCANVVHAASGRPLLAPSAILDAGGARIGFIGAVVASTPRLVPATAVEGLRFLDEADAINAEAEKLLKRGVRALVVVLHEGGRQDAYEGWTQDDAPEVRGAILSIARRLHPEIDLVVSGHSHQFTNARIPRATGPPVLVTQAWAAGTAFAEIELTIDAEAGDVTEARARVVTAWADDGPGEAPAADAAALAERAATAVAPRVERVVAHAGTAIARRPNAAGESALGNLVADAQREATGAQVALMNPGGLRADLDAGPVTWGELFAIQPFSNVLVTMDLAGADLLKALEPMGPPENLRVLHGSGVSWTWDPRRRAGERVVEARVGDAPIDPAGTYRVTVNHFLATGGDDVSPLTRGHSEQRGMLDLDALVAHLEGRSGGVSARIEGRVRLADAPSE